MEKRITGRAWVYGDNVDTDAIIPARHLTMTEPRELAAHCMEDLDATFVREVREGDIVVGGANFGCGSSREHAPLAFLGSGVAAVVAASFARIFFRNAINVGLPILECPDIAGQVTNGDTLSIDLDEGVIVNATTGLSFASRPFAPFLRDLVDAGGLVAYARRRLGGG